MSEMIINKTRYIIPFMVPLDADVTVPEKHWRLDSVPRGEHDMYQYILDSVHAGRNTMLTNICTAYRYEPDRHPILSLVFNSKERSYDFDVVDAGLFMFVSDIGFFWYETAMQPDIPDDELFKFNSSLKELNYSSNSKIIRQRDSEGTFMLGNWIASLLHDAVGEVTFFAERINVLYKNDPGNYPLYVPDKALICNYMVYEYMEDDELAYNAYHLTKGYKPSYHMPRNIAQRMKMPFDNVLWYCCGEGVGYYAIAYEDNRVFFTKMMSKRFFNDYFLIYMLVLNNRYALIRFAERIANELPADIESYLSPDLYPDMNGMSVRSKKDLYDLEQRVTRLVTEIDLFITKNIRASVSHTEHQNEFLEYLTGVFRIHESIEQLTMGVTALQRLLANLVEAERYFDNNEELMSWRKDSEYSKLWQEKEALQSEMYKDGLTGLLNQKGYIQFSKEIFDEAKENDKILFICSADMNGLKHINDTYGHAAGNNAIKGCVEILKAAAGKDDLICRTGGDEFVVLGLRDRIEGEEERFSKAAEEMIHKLNDGSGLPYQIAVSYGPVLQDMTSYTGNLEMLFKQSDDKMYSMKVLRDKYRRDSPGGLL